jgi:hypothetical protein
MVVVSFDLRKIVSPSNRIECKPKKYKRVPIA